MSEEKIIIGIEHALLTLARADQILEDITPFGESDECDDVIPWQAAHVWIFRAMGLLIDSLEGVETVTFSSEESIPVAKSTQPYTYLSARYAAIADRYKDQGREVEGFLDEIKDDLREFASPDDDE